MLRSIIVLSVLISSASSMFAQDGEKISVATLPPVVVKTVPQAGSTDVDPALKQIKITFSKRMLDKTWSWSQLSKETFPKVNEVKYLDDGKTCVADVELKPNRTYAFWLNSGKFGNFKDADGRSAVPYLLVFETGDGK